MKLKFDEHHHVVVQDGKPVYVHDDGKEIPFDAQAAMQKITSLNAEAKQHREAKETAEAKLKAFDGIEDAQTALKALATVKNLDDKKLIDAGEAERVKSEAIKVYEEKLAALESEKAKIQSQFQNELIGGNFARSKVIAEKLAIPVDMAQAFFGKHFTISEDGKMIAKDANGHEIYSRIHAGEKATFDEALETLINAYPNRDSILKGNNASGGGASANHGAAGRTMSRAEFEQLDPASQMKTLQDKIAIV